MILNLRTLTAAALIAVLALTGQTLAQLRAAPGPGGVMVICTGTGPLSVVVGADGQPTGRTHVCPDCALAAMAGLLPGPDAPVPAGAWQPASFEAPLAFAGHMRAPPRRARAPPLA